MCSRIAGTDSAVKGRGRTYREDMGNRNGLRKILHELPQFASGENCRFRLAKASICDSENAFQQKHVVHGAHVGVLAQIAAGVCAPNVDTLVVGIQRELVEEAKREEVLHPPRVIRLYLLPVDIAIGGEQFEQGMEIAHSKHVKIVLRAEPSIGVTARFL